MLQLADNQIYQGRSVLKLFRVNFPLYLLVNFAYVISNFKLERFDAAIKVLHFNLLAFHEVIQDLLSHLLGFQMEIV